MNDTNDQCTETDLASGSRFTIRYGEAPEQFGILHLPGRRQSGHDHRDADRDDDPVPVVVLVHGGFWRNRYDLTLMDPLATDLLDRGFTVWNIEYRRVGDDGGGWPGTLTDVAAATDHLTVAAARHPIDLTRIAVVGHSAGGHLALWIAGRPALPHGAPGASPVVTPIVAVGQGAVVDLLGAATRPLGNGAVQELLGGLPDAVPERYESARPRLDAGPRMVSVVGAGDDIVPPRYSTDPSRPGAIEVIEVAGADHFDLIDPTHEAWSAVIRVLDDMVDDVE